ncbi:probable galacturonosyltransferase 7 isoform X2 [Ricinus communis]|uniref:probable galacturonosyltransferase 7 isoform X2 n=1 Tax=Ricinus communis TaxID=3988 RepID=UPI0007724522|nr:probable galacturonosyltransferase 7 isoform X2 [Ricinus communis]|eukprot:XP_015575207.1 probable galacturonosyltransferase 7 isoform X2 [Ricinus communis]
MKGGTGVYQGKRRWRFLAVGVLFLVVLSMLVPLVFLLGLHNGFHTTGYASDHSSSSSDSPDSIESHANEERNLTSNTNSNHDSQSHPEDAPAPPHSLPPPPADGNNNNPQTADKTKFNRSIVDESEKLCELRYGSYCLWREQHREDMKDSMVKKLKDRLFVARSYYPSIAKLPGQSQLTQELKQCIQELERVFSESTTDADLKPSIQKTSERMEVAIAKSKKFPVECHNVARKLGQILEITEDEAHFHMRQSAFLYQLAVQTMPKSLHCLSMKLTVEYFNSALRDMELPPSEKFSDPTLHHYVMFSNNILASSVVINSTVTHTRDSGNMVFHVLTDEQNYFGMKLWFFRNTYREAAIQVLNIEHLDLDYHDKAALLSMSLPVEFRVSFHSVDNPSSTSLKTEYISVFSHAHYLLPYIFQNLKKVVVLDDDVVIQRDLSDLWNINLGGKVNGALQLCSVRLGQLTRYLGDNIFDKNSCLWMSGLNIIDLARWRELDLTETYRKLGQLVTKLTESIEGAALTASLLTFDDQIFALDKVWVLSGLGHDRELNAQDIKNAAVLHYNGKMKPWLELGIPKYKHYWKSYLNGDDQFLSQCNVNQ